MQFRDLNLQYNALKKELDTAINKVLGSGAFILGSQVRELEEKLADYIGVKHCITCANGTDALSLVLMAWGIGKGDAVFVPNFTYVATASAVSVLGATPVFVDIDKETYNMSTSALESSIEKIVCEGTLSPKVIIPVDLFGLPADYDEIKIIAEKHGLFILEDGAQGFGGEYKGKKACSFGNAATTSFFPAKPLGCYGDGGAIFTNDDELCTTLKMLRVNGASPENKYDNKIVGINSRLDTIQAAILLVKLDAFIKYELDTVNHIATRYTTNLSNKVVTPFIPDGYFSSWAQYTIRLPDKNIRDIVKARLHKKNIPTMVYYPKPLHKQEAFAGSAQSAFPNSIAATEQVLSLPMHPYLKEDDIDLICELLHLFLDL